MKGIFSFTKNLQRHIWSFSKKMYVVLWEEKNRNENSQKIYICHPIFFQKNVRLEWKVFGNVKEIFVLQNINSDRSKQNERS